MSSEIKQRVVYLLRRTDKDDDGTDVYVGSTSKTLRERLWDHRGEATRTGNENNRLYTKMREVGLGNWEMIPLLSFTCDKKTIMEFEKEWCNALNADLNTYSPISGFENKREYDADYYKFNIQNKRYRCEICDFSFGNNSGLQKHLKSRRHFWKYIYSVD